MINTYHIVKNICIYIHHSQSTNLWRTYNLINTSNPTYVHFLIPLPTKTYSHTPDLINFHLRKPMRGDLLSHPFLSMFQTDTQYQFS